MNQLRRGICRQLFGDRDEIPRDFLVGCRVRERECN